MIEFVLFGIECKFDGSFQSTDKLMGRHLNLSLSESTSYLPMTENLINLLKVSFSSQEFVYNTEENDTFYILRTKLNDFTEDKENIF